MQGIYFKCQTEGEINNSSHYNNNITIYSNIKINKGKRKPKQRKLLKSILKQR